MVVKILQEKPKKKKKNENYDKKNFKNLENCVNKFRNCLLSNK